VAIIPFPKKIESNVLDDFINRLSSYGFEINHLKQEGQIHRCTSSASGKRKDMAGWYVYYVFSDNIIARYGDWVIGETIEFDFFTGERVDFDNYKNLLMEQERLNKLEIERLAAKDASDIILSSVAIKSHPYLAKKGLDNRVEVLCNHGAIVVPVINIENTITSLQYILSDGKKQYLKGGRIKDGFSLIGLEYYQLSSLKEVGIAEGLATALTINLYTKTPLIMAHSCHKIKEVCNILLQYSNIEKIIIYADNDHKTDGNPGLTAAYEAQKLSQKIIVMYPKNIVGTDYNDVLTEKGEEELKEQLGLQKKLTLFKKISEIQARPPEFLIDGILEANTVACVYGEPGQGKTHIVLSMAVSCAAGMPWYGHEIKKHLPVLYICGEDIRGATTRIYSIAKTFGVKDIDHLKLYITESAVHFLDANAVHELKKEIKLLIEKPSLIIIDTLNRNLGDGDENSTKDMTKFFDAVDSLRYETDATIILVHHNSKNNPTSPRGSSVIYGGVTTQIMVNTSTENAKEYGNEFKKVINMVGNKQKADAEIEPMVFGLKVNHYGPYLKLLEDKNIKCNLILGNSPQKSPKWPIILESLHIHRNLKSNHIEFHELETIFTSNMLDGNFSRSFMDALLKEQILVITPVIDKFAINVLTLN
jgi:hypothetical protein